MEIDVENMSLTFHDSKNIVKFKHGGVYVEKLGEKRGNQKNPASLPYSSKSFPVDYINYFSYVPLLFQDLNDEETAVVQSIADRISEESEMLSNRLRSSMLDGTKYVMRKIFRE